VASENPVGHAVRWLVDPRASSYTRRSGQLNIWLMSRLAMLAAIAALVVAVLGRS